MQQSRGGVAAAQHQRARLPSLSLSLCPRRPQGLAGRPSLVLVRADPKVEGTREFREDTGEVSGPSSKKNADGSIYVDDSAPKVCVVKTPPLNFSFASARRALQPPRLSRARGMVPTGRRKASAAPHCAGERGASAERRARSFVSCAPSRRRRLVARSIVCVGAAAR